MTKIIAKCLCITILALVSVSCSSVINTQKINNFSVNYCKPTIEYDISNYKINSEKSAKQDSILTANLSEHDILLCKALNIENYIASHILNTDDTLNNLILKQKVSNRLILAIIEIDALAAELDCYAEKVGQVYNYVNSINEKNIKKLIFTSIGIDALTTSAAIFTENPYFAVGGGLASIVLNALTISPKGKKINLEIERNLLGNIWFNNNDNKAFPEFIWFVLNTKNFSNEKNISMRESVCNRWLEFEFEKNIDKKTEDLYFGNGGLYTADDLTKREHLTNDLQATVRTLKQDLRSLTYRIYNDL